MPPVLFFCNHSVACNLKKDNDAIEFLGQNLIFSLLFQKQFFHISELVDQQRMADIQLPFHKSKRPMPTSQLLCCNPIIKKLFVKK